MFRLYSFFCGLLLFVGCASVRTNLEKAGRKAVDMNEVVMEIPIQTPTFVDEEPLTNPELAVCIAELALTENGIDCWNRKVRISFFDGMYAITFLESKIHSDQDEYTVLIDASNSRIVKVFKEHKIKEHPPHSLET